MLLSQQIVHVIDITLDNKMDYACTAVRFAMDELRVSTLKDKRKRLFTTFVRGHDCFVIMPTGYGKTLCYA